ncbi:MAG TPA: hypothetical protein VGJ20_17480 [Xanthobacteraceae bacterium]
MKELQQFFLLEAAKYNVFPLDDRRIERGIPAWRGDLICWPGAFRRRCTPA